MLKRNADELGLNIESSVKQITHLYTTLTSFNATTEYQNYYDCIMDAITHDLNNSVHSLHLIEITFKWSIKNTDKWLGRSVFVNAFNTKFADYRGDILIWYLQEFSRLDQHGQSVIIEYWYWYIDKLTCEALKLYETNADFFNHLHNLKLLEVFNIMQRGSFVELCTRVDISKLNKKSKLMIGCLLDAPRDINQFEFWKHNDKVNIGLSMTYDDFVDQFAPTPNIKNRSKYTDMDIFTYSNKYVSGLFDHFDK